jgi:hypothetical protein
MRSPSERSLRLASLALVALAGCGNFSNEDIRFVEALPRREEIRVMVPAAAAPLARMATPLVAVAACAGLGTAESWLSAEKTGQDFNRGIDWVLGLVDVVRRIPPTHREQDLRRWGPFDDKDHPGNEIQIVFTRSWPAASAPDPRYAYSFEARKKAAGGAFTPIIFGTFVGASASRGRGQLELDFSAIWALGMQDADTPHGAMNVRYDRSGRPRVSHLTMLPAVETQGFGLVQFDYGFAGYDDGSGRFDFAFRNASGDLLAVTAGFDASGAGRDRVEFTRAGELVPVGGFDQCWTQDACLTWVDDPLNISCPAHLGCSGGAVASCVAVPGPVPALPAVP